MALLLPPYIEERLPAQAGNLLKFQFRLNKTIGLESVISVQMVIKSTIENQELYSIEIPKSTWVCLEEQEGIYEISYQEPVADDLTLSKLNIGDFYKVQLAFKDITSTIGEFSTVGIFKYIGLPPTYYINKIQVDGALIMPARLVVAYAQGSDPAEFPYSYEFNILEDKLIIDSSGPLYTNVYEPQLANLEWGSSYQIQAIIITNSGYRSELIQNNIILQTAKNDFYKSCQAEVNHNYINGVNMISLSYTVPEQLLGTQEPEYFIITRTESGTSNEHIIHKFVPEDYASAWTLTINDHTIESDIPYSYKIYPIGPEYQWWTPIVVTNADETSINRFEDIQIQDSENALTVRYNPNISSYKEVYQESKIDPLNSSKPFFIRNGRLQYKEFSINGLLYEDELYNVEQQRDRTQSDFNEFNNLSTYAKQRRYKNKILSWLNNGKIKLFRSPTEGNYLVRLMNISLSPEQGLGGLLHSFSATGYEAADYTYDNFVKYGLALTHELPQTSRKKEKPISFKEGFYILEGFSLPAGKSQGILSYQIRVTGQPGNSFQIKLQDSSYHNFSLGQTGYWEAQIDMPIVQIKSLTGNLFVDVLRIYSPLKPLALKTEAIDEVEVYHSAQSVIEDVKSPIFLRLSVNERLAENQYYYKITFKDSTNIIGAIPGEITFKNVDWGTGISEITISLDPDFEESADNNSVFVDWVSRSVNKDVEL